MLIQKRVLAFTVLCLTFITHGLATNRCYSKMCRQCDLRSGECQTCSGSAFFKDIQVDTTTNLPIAGTPRTDPACYTYTSSDVSLTEGCLEWTYTLATNIEKCYRCRVGYWRSFNGLKCTKNNDKKSCSANCKACYETDGMTIDKDGNNSVCTVCKQGFGQHITALGVCGTGLNFRVPKSQCGEMAGNTCIQCKNKWVFDTNGICVSESAMNSPTNCLTLALANGTSC